MRVDFTKVDAKRYTIRIRREHGPGLVPRCGPGYDDLMPHDLAHYVVEEFYRIELGVWGQLAAGGGGIFWPAPEDNTLRHQRRVERIGAVGRSDMHRSERLVVLTVAAWEQAIGRVKQKTRMPDQGVGVETLNRAVARMNDVAERWRSLPQGAPLTFEWPKELTLDVGRSRRGRRSRAAESARR